MLRKKSFVTSISLFSNWGLGTVHLAAPGEAILSTVPKGGYETFDGTSMATPHVTGVIGLLKAQDPTRDWRALKNLVLAGAVPPTQGKIPTLTGGRLYAPNSMTCTQPSHGLPASSWSRGQKQTRDARRRCLR